MLSLARLYHDRGVRKGDRVALMLHPSTGHVVALFAAVQIGAIPVALHVRESAAVLSQVVRRLAPRVLVYDADLAEKVGDLREASPALTGFVAARSVLTDPAAAQACPDPVIPDCLGPAQGDLQPAWSCGWIAHPAIQVVIVMIYLASAAYAICSALNLLPSGW